MRGPDSVPWYTLWDMEEDEQEPILAIPCPCCKGTAHSDLSACEFGIDLALSGEVVHVWMNTRLEELPACIQCFDAGVVPADEEEL